ncbi:hypothetical protein ACLESD_21090 [Pyxidicoccus sp. 3LFB2]
MNVKTLAAIVGTLSLSALATGCASTKSAEAQPATETTGAESTGTPATEATGTQEAAPAATPEKGAEGSCGSGSCGGAKKQ